MVVQKQRAGVYTVMLALSLLAIVVGCLFLYFVIDRYDGVLAPTSVQLQRPSTAAFAKVVPAPAESSTATGLLRV